MTDTMQHGPQTAEVEALLARARTLTNAEAQALVEAWDEALSAAWDEAWAVARSRAWSEAWYAVRDAARGAAWSEAWYAVRDAARALVARDLITPEGFTQAHYDLLTEPVASVIGKVHPDDKGLVVT